MLIVDCWLKDSVSVRTGIPGFKSHLSLSRHVSLYQMQLLLETFSNTDEMSVHLCVQT